MTTRHQADVDAADMFDSVVAGVLTFVLRGPRPPQFAALVAGSMLVACVAFSRVYLGVHYPSDVVAGAVLGASWSALASRLVHLWTSADERSEIPVRAQGPAWAR